MVLEFYSAQFILMLWLCDTSFFVLMVLEQIIIFVSTVPCMCIAALSDSKSIMIGNTV